MPKLSLKDITEAVDKKYGDLEVEVPTKEGLHEARFVALLRATPAQRDAWDQAFSGKETVERVLGAKLADREPDEVDRVLAVSKAALGAVAKSEKDIPALEEVFGDDAAMWQELLGEYNKATQPGEA